MIINQGTPPLFRPIPRVKVTMAVTTVWATFGNGQPLTLPPTPILLAILTLATLPLTLMGSIVSLEVAVGQPVPGHCGTVFVTGIIPVCGKF